VHIVAMSAILWGPAPKSQSPSVDSYHNPLSTSQASAHLVDELLVLACFLEAMIGRLILALPAPSPLNRSWFGISVMIESSFNLSWNFSDLSHQVWFSYRKNPHVQPYHLRPPGRFLRFRFLLPPSSSGRCALSAPADRQSVD